MNHISLRINWHCPGSLDIILYVVTQHLYLYCTTFSGVNIIKNINNFANVTTNFLYQYSLTNWRVKKDPQWFSTYVDPVIHPDTSICPLAMSYVLVSQTNTAVIFRMCGHVSIYHQMWPIYITSCNLNPWAQNAWISPI